MSDIIAFLVGMIMFLVIPTLLIILIVRAIKKKTVKKVAITLAICAGSIVPLSILGTFTDPATWCDHEYEITQEIAPTCSEKGEIHRHCPLCEDDDIEYVDTTPHQWDTDRVVEATCTSEGYILKRCKVCSSELKTDNSEALGHAMTEVSRTDPTYDAEGKIVRKCDRCEHEEVESIAKLELEVIEFDGLELTFGNYSFTEVDNRFSEYDGATVVKIPVTIKNVSRDPHSLYVFNYKLFSTSGVESANVGYYFSDDVSEGGDLLPGASYVKYFHFVYDGDGVYTIVFDDMLLEKETMEIQVKK